MATPEGKVTQAIVKELKRMRDSGERIAWVKIHGGPMQKAGLPDLHITYDGRSYWIEVKAGNNKLTPLQCQRLEEFSAAGAVVGVARSVDELRNIFEVSKTITETSGGLT